MTTLDPAAGYVVLINTFEVDPSRAEELLTVLSQATANTMRHAPGFVSANLHISADRRHVANHAQWRSQADIDAMMRGPGREHTYAKPPRSRSPAATSTSLHLPRSSWGHFGLTESAHTLPIPITEAWFNASARLARRMLTRGSRRPRSKFCADWRLAALRAKLPPS